MTTSRDRMLDSIITAIDRHRLNQLITTVRTIAAYNASGIDTIDGYPTTTPLHGNVGAGSGATIVVDDEHGNPERIPVTSTEAAAFARHDHSQPDEIHNLHRANVQALRKILDGMNTIAANAKRAENLRNIADVPEPPMCYVAGTILGLPWDLMWEPAINTDFHTYLPHRFDEPRRVCRPIYDFVRQYRRLPTIDECKYRLEKGYFRVHQLGERT